MRRKDPGTNLISGGVGLEPANNMAASIDTFEFSNKNIVSPLMRRHKKGILQ